MIPSFSMLYASRRAEAEWWYRLNLRLGSTQEHSLADVEDRLRRSLAVFQVFNHTVFGGRRYGAARRVLADVRRGRRRLAQTGGGG